MEDAQKQMLELENLIEINQKEALIKMIDLYKNASDSYNHEVCDAIDIWISETHDKNLIDYIKEKMSKESDKYLIKKYQEWLSYQEDERN